MTLADNRGLPFGELSIEAIAGSPAPIGGVLRFWLRFALPAREGCAELFDPIAKLSVGNGLFITRLLPERAGSISASTAARNFETTFEAEVAPRHVEAIERTRAGGDLETMVAFSGRLVATTGHNFPYDQVRKTVPQSEWVKVLAELGYPRMRLLEIPIAEGRGDPNMERAVGLLDQAERKIQSGDYRGAIGHCRESLEALADAAGDANAQPLSPVGATNMFKDTESFTKTERLRLVRRATRILTHPSHHVGAASGTPPHDWDRSDAISIVAIVAALIKQCSARA